MRVSTIKARCKAKGNILGPMENFTRDNGTKDLNLVMVFGKAKMSTSENGKKISLTALESILGQMEISMKVSGSTAFVTAKGWTHSSLVTNTLASIHLAKLRAMANTHGKMATITLASSTTASRADREPGRKVESKIATNT
jgi:hypothetical protein